MGRWADGRDGGIGMRGRGWDDGGMGIRMECPGEGMDLQEAQLKLPWYPCC